MSFVEKEPCDRDRSVSLQSALAAAYVSSVISSVEEARQPDRLSDMARDPNDQRALVHFVSLPSVSHYTAHFVTFSDRTI